MDNYIDLKKLGLDELMGVVNLYPWFGNARKELCRRMAGMGDAGMTVEALEEAALYVSSRRALAEIRRAENHEDCSDKDVALLLKSYLGEPQDTSGEPESAARPEKRQVYVVGGDYFSQSQYEGVKQDGGNVFARFAAKAREEEARENVSGVTGSLGFYTETLAQIYAEQGYLEQAKEIYSKLILAYPEKNAYFASLIQKLDEEFKN